MVQTCNRMFKLAKMVLKGNNKALILAINREIVKFGKVTQTPVTPPLYSTPDLHIRIH